MQVPIIQDDKTVWLPERETGYGFCSQSAPVPEPALTPWQQAVNLPPNSC